MTKISFGVLASSFLLLGCGGGGASHVSSRAALKFTLDWPDRSRAMPIAANSAVVVLRRGGAEIGRTTINRTSGDAASVGTYTFEGLAGGDATIDVTAYPEVDGGGNAVATGLANTALQNGKTVQETATLATTATSLDIVPTQNTIQTGGTGEIGVTVRDIDGDLVLTRSGDSMDPIVWEADAPHVRLSRTANGAHFEGVSEGTVRVTARFEGLSDTETIHVVAS